MTHPGVGALTALAIVLILEEAERFGCGKQIASYLGLVPQEDSSGERRRLGHISKQGNPLLRFRLVEAAQVTVRSDPRWRNRFFHLAKRPVSSDFERNRDFASTGRSRTWSEWRWDSFAVSLAVNDGCALRIPWTSTISLSLGRKG